MYGDFQVRCHVNWHFGGNFEWNHAHAWISSLFGDNGPENPCRSVAALASVGSSEERGKGIALITAASCKKNVRKISLSGLAVELSKLESAICGDGWMSN